jgi:glycerol kinase
MVANAGFSLKELRVDGGAVCNAFLLQFQADMLNVPVRRSAIKEASAYGAVLMNALALGRRQSLQPLLTMTSNRLLVRPTMKPQDRERNYAGWRKAVSLINP